MPTHTTAPEHSRARRLLTAMAAPLDIAHEALAGVQFADADELPSVFAVSDFAAASVATAGAALAAWVAAHTGRPPAMTVSRRLASLWFGTSVQPQGWTLAPAWDAIAGDYTCADGWLRLHTNAPHHRAAALRVLGLLAGEADKAVVAAAVAGWQADALEAAVVAAGGCAAVMRSPDAWAAHAQGASVMGEPLLATRVGADRRQAASSFDAARPLQGVRVLDLTRVLAGPVATRFLAGWGAEVLRIDPPDWDEPAVAPDLTLGKRCARLDLRQAAQREQFINLLREADVLVHGYRADALARLGLDEALRRSVRPGLIDVALNAYGWSGPWRERRGFDSLVQMSAGIAHAGMQRLGKDRPTPLPVQALDHATGYLMAAAVLRGLSLRREDGRGFEARTSLARVATLLASEPAAPTPTPMPRAGDADFAAEIEPTDFGPARRLRPPLTINGMAMSWARPASRLGSAPPAW
jgi:CoA-transferase family III